MTALHILTTVIVAFSGGVSMIGLSSLFTLRKF